MSLQIQFFLLVKLFSIFFFVYRLLIIMFTAQFKQKILPNFEKVLSKRKFGEIYY